MNTHSTIDGIDRGPLAALIGTWEGDKGDDMRCSESTVLDIYDKKSYDHSDVNTLRRIG